MHDQPKSVHQGLGLALSSLAIDWLARMICQILRMVCRQVCRSDSVEQDAWGVRAAGQSQRLDARQTHSYVPAHCCQPGAFRISALFCPLRVLSCGRQREWEGRSERQEGGGLCMRGRRRHLPQTPPNLRGSAFWDAQAQQGQAAGQSIQFSQLKTVLASLGS
jgi:hypothetical protein